MATFRTAEGNVFGCLSLVGCTHGCEGGDSLVTYRPDDWPQVLVTLPSQLAGGQVPRLATGWVGAGTD